VLTLTSTAHLHPNPHAIAGSPWEACYKHCSPQSGSVGTPTTHTPPRSPRRSQCQEPTDGVALAWHCVQWAGGHADGAHLHLNHVPTAAATTVPALTTASRAPLTQCLHSPLHQCITVLSDGSTALHTSCAAGTRACATGLTASRCRSSARTAHTVPALSTASHCGVCALWLCM
jgi:hypothetical protein